MTLDEALTTAEKAAAAAKAHIQRELDNEAIHPVIPRVVKDDSDDQH
jgi:hypothetical protein